MRALRTIPVLLDVCRDMEELCPDALLLQYVNPMAMLCWAVAEASADPHRRALPLGPAHRRPSSRATSASRPTRSTTSSPGSTTWPSSSRFERGGEDLYPALREVDAAGPTTACATRCCSTSASFVTESSEHFAEYVPWFIKAGRPDLIERFNVPLDEYPRRCERADRRVGRAARGPRGGGDGRAPSGATSTAPTSCARARPARRSASTATCPTAGRRPLIDNLPPTAASRCPCVADAGGIEPQPVGALRRQLAALMQTNVNVQGLDGRGGAHRPPRARLPRGDARPAHGRRAAARRDPRAGRRAARRARNRRPRRASMNACHLHEDRPRPLPRRLAPRPHPRRLHRGRSRHGDGGRRDPRPLPCRGSRIAFDDVEAIWRLGA